MNRTMGTLIISIGLASFSTLLHAGDESHGGDTWALDFVSVGNRVVEEIRGMAPSAQHGVNPDNLAKVVDSTKVESTPESLYDASGAQKTALNFPAQKRILLSRPSWDNVGNMILRRILVLHEYLGIMEVDDTNGQISAKVYPNQLSGNDPCENNRAQLTSDAILQFRKYGHMITEANLATGNDTDTTAGGFIRVLRGYEVNTESWHVKALMVIAECDPVAAKYKILATSASGSGLKALCPGSNADLCAGVSH